MFVSKESACNLNLYLQDWNNLIKFYIPRVLMKDKDVVQEQKSTSANAENETLEAKDLPPILSSRQELAESSLYYSLDVDLYLFPELVTSAPISPAQPRISMESTPEDRILGEEKKDFEEKKDVEDDKSQQNFRIGYPKI